VKTINTFIKTKDNKSQTIGKHEIPLEWWSRGYEYEWAKQFVVKGHNVLDAGCGIEHPFKYYLADMGCKVTAVDKDEATKDLKYKNTTFLQSELKNLSSELPVNSFDTIFCISVLEHIKSSLKLILDGFNAILKNDGKVIITFDFPLLTPEELYEILLQTNLKFDGQFNFETSDKDLVGYHQSYRVFKAVLVKKNKGVAPAETKVVANIETK
jgi:SAM-dependent methyltransferase